MHCRVPGPSSSTLRTVYPQQIHLLTLCFNTLAFCEVNDQDYCNIDASMKVQAVLTNPKTVGADQLEIKLAKALLNIHMMNVLLTLVARLLAWYSPN